MKWLDSPVWHDPRPVRLSDWRGSSPKESTVAQFSLSLTLWL